MSGIAWLRCGAGRTRHSVAVTAAVGVVAVTLAAAPLPAEGEVASQSAAGEATCPSSNPPNMLTLMAGTPQTAMLGSAFATGLQVALTNSDGCPVTTDVAGIAVTFSSPSGGAGGSFSSSGSSAVTVGSDASGNAAAPIFTANDTAGSYVVTASSEYGRVSFYLTNTATGLPAKIAALSLASRSATVMSRYSQPLQVRVLDAGGNPVVGATVTFSLGSSAAGSSACDATGSAGASFIGASTQASATTGAAGVATSPPFAANSASGSFSASAAVTGSGAAAASGGESTAISGIAPPPVSFALANRAGKPTKLTAGVAAMQSAPAGTRFPIRLAVTVTDAEKNPAPGALVTFAAPAGGPSGRFTTRSHGSHDLHSRTLHPRTVKVKSDACGIAVAPVFTADRQQGGYIVRASVKHVRPAAFALVNEGP